MREAAAKVERRIAAENPVVPPASPRPDAQGEREPDPVDRIMGLIKGLSAPDFDRLKTTFREFCGA